MAATDGSYGGSLPRPVDRDEVQLVLDDEVKLACMMAATLRGQSAVLSHKDCVGAAFSMIDECVAAYEQRITARMVTEMKRRKGY